MFTTPQAVPAKVERDELVLMLATAKAQSSLDPSQKPLPAASFQDMVYALLLMLSTAALYTMHVAV